MNRKKRNANNSETDMSSRCLNIIQLRVKTNYVLLSKYHQTKVSAHNSDV